MDVLLLFAGVILVFTIYKQMSDQPSYTEVIEKDNERLAISEYNPYLLNQYVEWKDRMFSADVNENDIFSKPSMEERGIYGITEDQIRLNPVDAKVSVNRKDNLNL